MGFLDDLRNIFRKKELKPVETLPIKASVRASFAHPYLSIRELENILKNGSFLYHLQLVIYDRMSDGHRNRILFEVRTYEDERNLDRFREYIEKQADIV